MRCNILIVDDEPVYCKMLQKFITNMGHNPIVINSGIEAIGFAEDKVVVEGDVAFNNIDVVLLDLVMPDVDGMTVFKKLRDIKSQIQVIVLTATDDVATAVNAINFGASDYIIKSNPDLLARLTTSINNAIDKKYLKYQLSNLARSGQNEVAFSDIIGQSDKLLQMIDLARKAANISAPILIEGLYGSGKELLARAIHGSSARSGKPFVIVDCETLDQNNAEVEMFGFERTVPIDKTKIGKFGEVDGGTIFFKKIDLLTLNMQVKVLRFLQDGEFYPHQSNKLARANVKFIASTSRDLASLVVDKKFREDFRYAISVFPISVPTLKMRGCDDIRILAEHFCHIFSINENRRVTSISPSAIGLLCEADWKDNIRQLKNYIFRAVVLCEGSTILPEHFPQLLSKKFSDIAKDMRYEFTDCISAVNIFDEHGKCKTLSDIDEEVARKLVVRYDGNISEVSKALNIARSTLYRKLRIDEKYEM